MNQASNVEESKLRVVSASRSARVARLRSVDDCAISTREAVPHLAAA